LNSDCNLIHGNLTIDAIFVNKAGDWKLAAFDLLSSLSQDSSSILKGHSEIVSQKYKSPEYQKGNWNAIANSPIWAIDAWMLGCVIFEIYNGKLNQIEDLKKTSNIPKTLLGAYQQLLISNPAQRLSLSKFLESSYFLNPYVETCLFLEQINLKDDVEKDKFFKKLDKLLDDFPASACKYKILPHLVTALDFGSANSRVLGPLLRIGKLLTPEEYSARITPSVIKWFASNDRTFRTSLLQNLEHFVEHLSASLVDEQIFPNVATGFTDVSPVLRELTVKSMLLLVPKMSEKTINTQLLRSFSKLQMDEEPGIRTNTTVCLAKIASYLSVSTRKKILVPAFSRALRDPFPKARITGILSFIATQNYYEKELFATKIIPCISLATIDPEKEVRDAAFKAITIFLDKLKQISDTGVENMENPDSTKENETMIGWALNSLSKKFYGEGSTQATGSTRNTLSANSISATIEAKVDKEDSEDSSRTKNDNINDKESPNLVKAEEDDADFNDENNDYNGEWINSFNQSRNNSSASGLSRTNSTKITTSESRTKNTSHLKRDDRKDFRKQQQQKQEEKNIDNDNDDELRDDSSTVDTDGWDDFDFNEPKHTVSNKSYKHANDNDNESSNSSIRDVHSNTRNQARLDSPNLRNSTTSVVEKNKGNAKVSSSVISSNSKNKPSSAVFDSRTSQVKEITTGWDDKDKEWDDDDDKDWDDFEVNSNKPAKMELSRKKQISKKE